MAKGRSRRAQHPDPASRSSADRATLGDAAVAVLVTGSAFMGDWLALAGAQAGKLTHTLAGVLTGDDTFEEGARSALDVYSDGLRQMALLPRTYGLRFYQELEQNRTGHEAQTEPRRPRSARRGRSGRKR